MMRLLLLLTFFAGALRGAPASGNPSLAALGGLPATVPGLAELSPQQIGDSANAGLYWMGALLVVLQIGSYFRPQPALHKQFADKEDTDKKLEEVKALLKDFKATVEDWSSDHYDARRRMHRKINHALNALTYLAGTMESRDPSTARHIKEIIDRAEKEADDE